MRARAVGERRLSRREGAPHARLRAGLAEAFASQLRRTPVTLVSSALVLLALSLLGGCQHSLASDSAPDFAGTWDVTYDDAFEVELQQGTQTLRGRVSEQGGAVSFGGDAGMETALHVNCAADDVLCPSEVWPRELQLSAVPGVLDPQGTQLMRPLGSTTQGACAPKAGSVLTGEVLTTMGAQAARAEALALTSGRIHLRFNAACFATRGTLSPDAEVVLSVGYTAAKR